MWVFDLETLSFLTVNDAAVRHYGYSREEFLSMTVADIRPPEDRERLAAALGARRSRAVNRTQRYGIWRHVRADGSVIDVEVFAAEVTFRDRSAGLVLALDVTERLRVQHELGESERRFRVLAENSSDLISRHDLRGRFLYASPACSRLLGYEPDELIGHDYFEFLHPDDPARVIDTYRGIVIAGNTLTTQYRVRAKDGTYRWFESTAGAVPYPGTGEIAEFVAVARDITDRKDAEQKLQQSEARVRLLSHRLLQSQEAERRRVARELHDELGQTLTGLKLVLEGVRRRTDSGAATQIAKAQSVADRLLTQMRSLSLDLRPPLLDDFGLLAALLEHFAQFSRETAIAVRFRHYGIGERHRSEVETTAFRIIQEALTNVARHSQAAEVSIRLLADEETIEIEIEDLGRGFDPRTAAGVRAAGLSGMRERAVLLGGVLEVTSKPGQGTRIRADLPRREPATEPIS